MSRPSSCALRMNDFTIPTNFSLWPFDWAYLGLLVTVFAVTPFLGDITPFSKPGRRFGNYVASLGRSFTVVNIVGSRPLFAFPVL